MNFVKCPNCKNIIRTKKEDVCQCPLASDGCGERVKVQDNLVNL